RDLRPRARVAQPQTALLAPEHPAAADPRAPPPQPEPAGHASVAARPPGDPALILRGRGGSGSRGLRYALGRASTRRTHASSAGPATRRPASTAWNRSSSPDAGSSTAYFRNGNATTSAIPNSPSRYSRPSRSDSKSAFHDESRSSSPGSARPS